MNTYTLCVTALGLWTSHAADWFEPRLPAMTAVCEEVAEGAVERGEDPALFVSLAWEESRFRYIESPAGAVGPLQAMPQHWCPNGQERGCDLIDAGFTAYDSFRERFPGLRETLCHYNAGTRACPDSSYAYADRILSRYEELIEGMEASNYHVCGC